MMSPEPGGPPDPFQSEQVLGAVNELRGVIEGLYGRIRGGDEKLTCGEVVKDLGNAVEGYVATANRFISGNPVAAALTPFHISVAVDVVPFLAFEEPDPQTPAIAVAPAQLPHEAEALAALVAPTPQPASPPTPSTPPPTLERQALDLLDKFVERAARSTASVLTAGAFAVSDLLVHLAGQIPLLADGLKRLSGYVHHLLGEASKFMSRHFGVLPGVVLDLAKALDPLRLAEEYIKPPLDRLLKAEGVRKELRSGAPAATRANANRLHDLDKANARAVGWARTVAPVALRAVSLVAIGPVPAWPVVAGTILAWILFVSADQLSADVPWRLHLFPGILDSPKP